MQGIESDYKGGNEMSLRKQATPLENTAL